MKTELLKQVEQYLEQEDSNPAVGKVLLKLLCDELQEKEKRIRSLEIDLKSEQHSRALDNCSAADYY